MAAVATTVIQETKPGDWTACGLLPDQCGNRLRIIAVATTSKGLLHAWLLTSCYKNLELHNFWQLNFEIYNSITSWLVYFSISFSVIGVAFSQQTYTVNEDAGFANVVVQIQTGMVEKEIMVR